MSQNSSNIGVDNSDTLISPFGENVGRIIDLSNFIDGLLIINVGILILLIVVLYLFIVKNYILNFKNKELLIKDSLIVVSLRSK